ncbi:MAG: hypothetical protein KAU07_03580 [Candidatus Andersenbacteria bacterium]|nr:hypothetical protein [Candidatus Andersenbacteria bacterium]
MKRHKVWYKRELFKNHFKSYKDWDDFNPPSGEKHSDRYKSEALQCKNPECPREGMLISEHEAFYYFASRSFTKKVRSKITGIVKEEKKYNQASIYVCPFCGGKDVREA